MSPHSSTNLICANNFNQEASFSLKVDKDPLAEGSFEFVAVNNSAQPLVEQTVESSTPWEQPASSAQVIEIIEIGDEDEDDVSSSRNVTSGNTSPPHPEPDPLDPEGK